MRDGTFLNPLQTEFVMPGLVPGIHVYLSAAP
jgi:hypothetical protein